METIFQHMTLDRSLVKWEDSLDVLTPIIEGSRWRYKREDLWAPLGPGCVNGFKLRQGVWFLSQFEPAKTATAILFGGSVKSTQHSMIATVSRYFGKRSTHVLGATSPLTCLKHDSVAIAELQGAEFDFIGVAYTQALQRRVAALRDSKPGAFAFEYGVGLDHHKWPIDSVRSYHAVGARQAANLPPDLTDLVMPAGSCHASVSILIGMLEAGVDVPAHLVGIGPSRMAWMADRFDSLGYSFHADSAEAHIQRGWIKSAAGRKVSFSFYDLVGSGFATYQEMWKEECDGIQFHPTYEAKMMRWLRAGGGADYLGERAVVWIVGAEPKLASMSNWGRR